MIQQGQQNVIKLGSLLQRAQKIVTQEQTLELYQQITVFLSNQYKKEDLFKVLNIKLTNTRSLRLFEALFDSLVQKISTKNQVILQEYLLSFIKNQMQKQMDDGSINLQRGKTILSSLMQSKGSLLQKATFSCRQSQVRAKNMLLSASEMLMSKVNQEPIINMNLTFTSLLAFKSIQSWQSIDSQLLQQALRHILILDMIQKGQIRNFILSDQAILDKLIQIGQQTSTIPYWFCLVAGLAQYHQNQNLNYYQKVEMLYQNALKKIESSVELQKDLSEQIYNVLESDECSKQKKKLIQTIRSFSIFVSTSARKQLVLGALQQKRIKLIEQLMGIKDFLSFEFLSRIYADLIKNEVIKKQDKLQFDLIQKIQRNCLPLFRKKQTFAHQYDSAKVLFLANGYQSLVQYQASQESSEAMRIITQKILQGRGCILKARICPCFDEYIYSTIQSQYDNKFNHHQFMSVSHLMCRQILRVQTLSPSVQQLQKVKEYLIDRIKWLLNLNQSCLPQHRKCIHFKIFDLILTFPFILLKNQFLEKVVCDLLIEKIPNNFYHIEKIIPFLKEEERQHNKNNATIFQRITQQILEKARNQKITLYDKIQIWNLIIVIWENNQTKLDQLFQLYSLYEDHWIAKYCAAKHRKIKLLQPLQQKAIQIILKMEKSSNFYRNNLKMIDFLSKVQ